MCRDRAGPGHRVSKHLTERHSGRRPDCWKGRDKLSRAGSRGKNQPPNLMVSRKRIASRWLAITCACQRIATDIRPINITQIAKATFVCDSAAGRRRVRTSQAMGNLLVPLVLRCSRMSQVTRRGRNSGSNLSSTAHNCSRSRIIQRIARDFIVSRSWSGGFSKQKAQNSRGASRMSFLFVTRSFDFCSSD